MKKLLILLLLAFCSQITKTQEANSDGPLLTILLMVKNEEAVMLETLRPYLEAGLQHFVVLDTGSTDNTVQVTQQIFDTYNVTHAHIVQKPFVDYATSRNHLIEAAEQIFPSSVFLLMIDAEWYTINVDGIINFCKENQNSPETSFFVKLTGSDTQFSFYVQRLFRAHHFIRFAGVVHETIMDLATTKLPSDIYFIYNPAPQGTEATQRRWNRDVNLLLQEYEKNPHNPRTIFYLAQTYECLNDHENAITWYKKRLEIKGGYEEEYLSMYRMAKIYETIGNWNQALHWYLQAYNARRTRAEPLIRIAYHYWTTQDYPLAFLFAKYATEIKFPDVKWDWCCIEKTLYDLTRWQILRNSAWYLDEIDIGIHASAEILKYYPDAENKETLNCFLNKKSGQS